MTDMEIELSRIIGRLECALNPRSWSPEQSFAWHSSLPDLQKAFSSLRAATTDQLRILPVREKTEFDPPIPVSL